MGSTGFFWKLTFRTNKAFQTWGTSVQLPCAREGNFDPIWSNLTEAITSLERLPGLEILSGCLQEVQEYS